METKVKLKENQIEYDDEVFTRDKRTGYYLSAKPIYNNKRIMLHRYVWIRHNGKIPDGYIVHHIDENKENNDISNFELMTNYDHSKMHGDEIAKNNYEELMKNLSSRFSEETKEKQKQWRESDEGKNFYIEQAKYIKSLGVYEKTETKQCLYCGKEIKLARMYYDKTKYCSKACSYKHKKEIGYYDIEKICVICGKKFIGNKRKQTKTCSKECKAILIKNKNKISAL